MASMFGMGPGLREWLDECQQDAINRARAAAPERVRFSTDGVAAEIVAAAAPDLVQIDWTKMTRSETEESTRQLTEFGETIRQPGLTMTVHVPFTGDPKLLNLQASTFTLAGRREIQTWNGDIVFQVDVSEGDANLTRQRIDSERTRISQLVDWANNDVVNWLPGLKVAVGETLHRRKAELDKAAALDAALELPIRPASGDQQVKVPVARRTVRLVRSARGPDPKDPRLSDQIYEDVLDTLRSVGNAFERLPKTATRFQEEELRDLLLFILNSNYEGLVRGEVFNGAGKTDILIPYQDHNAFIGECKLWNGSKAFTAAIDQLLGYTVWRDTKAALILFIKGGDASGVIKKAANCIKDHRCFVAARPAADADSRQDYLLHASDDPSKHIQVALLPIIVRTASEDN